MISKSAHHLCAILLTLTLIILCANANVVNNRIFNTKGNQLNPKDDDDSDDCDDSDEKDDDRCKEKGKSDSETWTIVGVVIGAVLGAVIIIVLIICICKRRRGSQQWFWTRHGELNAAAKATPSSPIVVMELSTVNPNQQFPPSAPISRTQTSSFSTESGLPGPSQRSTDWDQDSAIPEMNASQYPFNQEFAGPMPMDNIYEEPPPPYNFAVDAVAHHHQHEMKRTEDQYQAEEMTDSKKFKE